MDTSFQAFVALFYAVDHLYDKCPCDTTGLCAGELNPFLWKAIGSADPAHYIEFKQDYDARFSDKQPSAKESYAFLQEYVAKLSEMFNTMFPEDETLANLFKRYMDEETWAAIWALANEAAAKRIKELGAE